jgi:hypothetical protein
MPITGRYINLKKLNNDLTKFSSSPTAAPFYIDEIKIYDDKSNQINITASNITASKHYNNDANYSINNLVDNKIGGSYYFRTNTGDLEPYINIDLTKNKVISKIEIYIAQNMTNNILNTLVEIFNENNEKINSNVITPSIISNNIVVILTDCKKCEICPVCVNCQYTSPSQCPKQTRCLKTYDDILANSNITNCTEKLKNINTKINETNNMLTELFSLQAKDITNTLNINNKNLIKLKSINNDLVSKVSNLGPSPIIMQISNQPSESKQQQKIEGFTNMVRNDNKYMDINSNDVSQYKKSIKDKNMEKFANFVQPKIHIYEGFDNWEQDWNAKKFNIAYNSPYDNETLNQNMIKTTIPIVRNPNIETNLTKKSADVMAFNMKNKANLLNGAWLQ